MKMSEALKIINGIEDFCDWLARKLQSSEDNPAELDTIHYAKYDCGEERIELEWSAISSCECCGYTYFGTTLRLQDIDRLYKEYLSKQ